MISISEGGLILAYVDSDVTELVGLLEVSVPVSILQVEYS